MSQSAIAIAGGGSPPSAKVRAPRSDIGKTKTPTEKCGCCGKLFVTLARHYRVGSTIVDGVAVLKASKCASWAISQGIDAKSLSKEKSGPATPAGRKGILRSLKCLLNAEILTEAMVKNLMKKVDEKHPETEEDEEEDD